MSHPLQTPLKLSYRDYCLIPNDGKRHEIIDGEHYVNPAPETYHQTLSRRIQFQLYVQIEESGRGQVFNAPTDLQFSEHDVVQPDILVILDSKRHIITPAKVKGVPDLLIEILSPSTREHDRERKHRLFERAGVPEYWTVDPDDHLVEEYLLEKGRYRLAGRHAESISFHGLPDVTVNLRKVW